MLVVNMMHIASTTPWHKQQGVGLIEILVTLFILSIGLLGVAALQFTGSFANRDAISRTQSEFVASQVAERLRIAARPASVGDGMVVHNRYFNSDNYNFTELSCSESSHPYRCYCLERPSAIPNCESSTCNEEDMAKYDGWALSCSAVQTNPQTVLSLSCTDNNTSDIYSCSAGSFIQVTLTWPLSSTSGRQYTLNARCNTSSNQSNACVVKDLVL